MFFLFQLVFFWNIICAVFLFGEKSKWERTIKKERYLSHRKRGGGEIRTGNYYAEYLDQVGRLRDRRFVESQSKSC